MNSNSNLKDTNRNNCVNKINSILDDIDKSRNIEKSIYNSVIVYSKENNINRRWDNRIFYNIYFSKIRSIYINLNKNSYVKNDYLYDKIKNDEIKAEEISKLSVYDVYPDNWRKMIDEKIKRDKMKYELKPEAMTERYKCRRCGSRKCSYYELQTRSADEPMTQFFTCLDCKNRWKM
jgi:transcription elongation factor S-II